MKIIRVIAYVILFVILSVSLAGCSSGGENNVLNEKIASELTYLDTKLIEMINSTNGISLENYIVKAEKIEEESANKDTSNKGSSASEQNAESSGTSSETGEEAGSSAASGQGGGQSSGQENGQSGGGQSSNNVKYQMQGNEILLQDRTPKWQEIKADIEKMYSDWSTIILDLYEANVDSQDILNFNQDLDLATR